MKLRIHAGARRDLREAAHYYQAIQKRLGDELVTEVHEVFRQLVEVTCAGSEFSRSIVFDV